MKIGWEYIHHLFTAMINSGFGLDLSQLLYIGWKQGLLFNIYLYLYIFLFDMQLLTWSDILQIVVALPRKKKIKKKDLTKQHTKGSIKRIYIYKKRKEGKKNHEESAIRRMKWNVRRREWANETKHDDDEWVQLKSVTSHWKGQIEKKKRKLLIKSIKNTSIIRIFYFFGELIKI